MKNILIFLFYISSIQGFSQNKSGFFGAKYYVSISSLSNIPLINKYANNNFNNNNFNLAYKASFNYILCSNKALGIEVGTSTSKLSIENFDNSIAVPTHLQQKIDGSTIKFIDLNNEIEYPTIDIRSYSFMPKIEFTSRGLLLPASLSHQIGLGVNNTKVIEREYGLTLDPIYIYNSVTDSYSSIYPVSNKDFNTYFYNYRNKSPILSYTLMYACNVRTPLSKRLFIDFGIRYTLNLSMSDRNSIPAGKTEYFYTSKDIQNRLFIPDLLTIMQFNLGVTYAF